MTFMTSPEATRFIRHGHACLGVSGPAGLTLTAGGHNDSLLWSRNPAAGAGQLHTWSPWGNGKATDGLPGFNGERCDPVSGSYHLGNGYRAYNPILRRFNCPDSLSPFRAGGINPYAYCAGDPVNHTDPTGHISWQGILGIVAGAIGVLLTGGSALGAIAAAGSVAAAWSAASTTTLVVGSMGLLADATGIASGATEDSNPAASSVLGWVSMATGIAGMAAGMVLAPKGINALKTIRENNNSASGISSSARPSLHRAPSLSSTWIEVYERMGVHFNPDETFEFNEWHSFANSEHSRPSVSSFGSRASTSSRASTTSSYERWWEETHTLTSLFPKRKLSEVSVSGYENIHQLPTTELTERILNYRNNMSRIFPERLTKKQYRHLARRLHPDSSGSADTEEAFKIFNSWFNG